jgi:hypothetical protein
MTDAILLSFRADARNLSPCGDSTKLKLRRYPQSWWIDLGIDGVLTGHELEIIGPRGSAHAV